MSKYTLHLGTLECYGEWPHGLRGLFRNQKQRLLHPKWNLLTGQHLDAQSENVGSLRLPTLEMDPALGIMHSLP